MADLRSDPSNRVADLLAQSSVLRALARAKLERMAARTYERRLGAGDVLFKAGTDRTAIYVIVDGEIELSHEIHGKEDLVVRLGAGAEIGECVLLGPSRHTATARAFGASTVLELACADVRAVLSGDVEGTLDVVSRAAEKVMAL
jgi:CRP-like cAMP-binding protein